MSETPPPYTGRSAKTPADGAKPAKAARKPAAKAAAKPAAKPAASSTAKAAAKPVASAAPPVAPPAVEPPPVAPAVAPNTTATTPPAPQFAPVVSYVTIWHSRAVLIGVAAFAALAGIGTAIGAASFPTNAPVESIQAFGVVVDMIAVVVALVILMVVEFRRRADPVRLGLPVNPRPSVFAIIAIVMAGLTLLAWVVGGGPTQVIDLAQGLRARYMYHTGGLFIAGIPWALSLIFGAWGFRPKGNRVTNALAIAAVAVGGLLAVVAVVAALVYGAGLSD